MQAYLSNFLLSFFVLQAVVCLHFKLTPAQLLAENITISGEDIDSLDDNIGEAKNLKFLNINNTNITSLPEELKNCKSLETLKINSNEKLKDPFPDFLGDLTNLKELSLSDLPLMTRVPPKLIRLKKLEVLNISENNLKYPPYRILDLDNFKKLIIDKLQLASFSPSEEAETRRRFGEKLEIIVSCDDIKRLVNEAVFGDLGKAAEEVLTKDLGKCCIS